MQLVPGSSAWKNDTHRLRSPGRTSSMTGGEGSVSTMPISCSSHTAAADALPGYSAFSQYCCCANVQSAIRCWGVRVAPAAVPFRLGLGADCASQNVSAGTTTQYSRGSGSVRAPPRRCITTCWSQVSCEWKRHHRRRRPLTRGEREAGHRAERLEPVAEGRVVHAREGRRPERADGDHGLPARARPRRRPLPVRRPRRREAAPPGRHQGPRRPSASPAPRHGGGLVAVGGPASGKAQACDEVDSRFWSRTVFWTVGFGGRAREEGS